MTKSLFEQLGGREGISIIVDDTIATHLSNPGRWHNGNQPSVAMVAMVLGRRLVAIVGEFIDRRCRP